MSKATKSSGTIATKAIKATTKGKAPKAAPKATTKGKAPAPKAAPTEYAQIQKMVQAPLSERPTLAIGRNGAKVQPRRFHLLPDELSALKTEWKETKKMPLPFNKGAYFFFVNSLLHLGANKAHSFKTVKAEMVKQMSAAETKDDEGKTAWQRFSGKEAHTDNEETALNVDGKIKQNAEVLQRLGGMTPYGLKLLQVGQVVIGSKGACIDILKGAKDEPQYKLNLNSAEPMNEFRKRRSA